MERWDKYTGTSEDLTSNFLEEDEFMGEILSLGLGSFLSPPFPNYFSCPLLLLGLPEVPEVRTGNNQHPGQVYS